MRLASHARRRALGCAIALLILLLMLLLRPKRRSMSCPVAHEEVISPCCCGGACSGLYTFRAAAPGILATADRKDLQTARSGSAVKTATNGADLVEKGLHALGLEEECVSLQDTWGSSCGTSSPF